MAAALLLARRWLFTSPPVPGASPVPVAAAGLQVPAAASTVAAGAASAAAGASPVAEADCRASITPLARLRAAVSAALPDDSALAALLARLEKEEDTAQRAGAAAHATAVQNLRASADPVQHAAGRVHPGLAPGLPGR